MKLISNLRRLNVIIFYRNDIYLYIPDLSHFANKSAFFVWRMSEWVCVSKASLSASFYLSIKSYHRKRIQLLTSFRSIKISNFQAQTKMKKKENENRLNDVSFIFLLFRMERARTYSIVSEYSCACAKSEILANDGWYICHAMLLLPHPFFLIQTKMHMHTRMCSTFHCHASSLFFFFCGIKSSFNNKNQYQQILFLFFCRRLTALLKVNQANINSSIALLPRCRCTNKSLFWFTTNRWSLVLLPSLSLSLFRLKTNLFAFADIS